MNNHITSIQNYSHFVPIRTKENLVMFVNPNDQYISRSLMYTGEWEPHIVDIFKQYVKDGMVAMPAMICPAMKMRGRLVWLFRIGVARTPASWGSSTLKSTCITMAKLLDLSSARRPSA